MRPDAQYELKESEQRAELLKKVLDEQPERILASSATKYNPMIETMQERLLTLDLDEQHLLTLYTQERAGNPVRRRPARPRVHPRGAERQG